MTREDIIRMAREVGFSQPWTAPKETQKRLERFAALVAAHEREECAKLCDEYNDGRYANTADLCAEVIRARGRDHNAT
jgi:hypothetical protein